MAVGGICASCNKFSVALFTCKACGARVCPNCVDTTTGFCKLCGGRKKIKERKVIVS